MFNRRNNTSKILYLIYPLCNYIWKNISTIYIHNKIRIQRYILTSQQSNTNHIYPTTSAIIYNTNQTKKKLIYMAQ